MKTCIQFFKNLQSLLQLAFTLSDLRLVLRTASTLTVKESIKFHDRFLIIDKTTLIHGMRRRNALRFGG